MKIYRTDKGEDKILFSLLDKRAETSSADITEKVRDVINNVRVGGDAALLD